MAKLLIADDNKQLVTILKNAALKDNHTVVTVSNGTDALELFEVEQPDLVLLDVMMPEVDGFQVCRKIRAHSDVPIIMITACGEDFEKIMGLDTGADDYIVKPFSPGEVMARVRAVLRRIGHNETGDERMLSVSNLTVSLDTCSARIDGIVVALTKRETDMLYTLAKGRSRAYTRDMLLDLLWGYDYYGDPRTVDSHIKRLRAKLDVVPHPNWSIRTIRGVGYKFEVTDESNIS